MKLARVFFVAVFAAPLVLAGCAGAEDDEDPAAEDSALTGSSLTSSFKAGSKMTTTARLNFREGPSKQEDVMRILPNGATVTVVGTSLENGFLKVTHNGDEGWVFASYLKAASGSSSDTAPSPSSSSGGTQGVTTGKEGTGQVENCKASFYEEGQKTANGETFNPRALTAAHKTLKFNTMVRVTNKANGKTVDVRINDRGPFVSGRCIDLSGAAFEAIASRSAGVATVSVEVLK